MLELKHSLLIKEQILINVLKFLASIFSKYRLHVFLLSKIMPRYFTRGQCYSEEVFILSSPSNGNICRAVP
jgi:hypothetical protein